ncbi:MAG: four helix bundle protein [Flavobacteriales bacterium]|nr:four helix bundle protein [Flavobacteriales bacterium]
MPAALLDLSMDFAVKTVAYSITLRKFNEPSLSDHIFRSGTSIGAKLAEAQHAQDKADFLQNVKAAAEHSVDFKYWLTLCERSPLLPGNDQMQREIEVIGRVLRQMIQSSSTSRERSKLNIQSPHIEHSTSS